MPYKKSDVDYPRWKNAVEYEYGYNCMFWLFMLLYFILGIISLYRKNLFCSVTTKIICKLFYNFQGLFKKLRILRGRFFRTNYTLCKQTSRYPCTFGLIEKFAMNAKVYSRFFNCLYYMDYWCIRSEINIFTQNDHLYFLL